MVVESFLSPLNAEKKPWNLLFIGFFYASMAIFLSLWVFHEYSSLVMIFLTVLACVPLMYRTMRVEEKKDIQIKEESAIMKEHLKAIWFFMYLFSGITLAVAVWYVVLPSDVIRVLFNAQASTIIKINSRVTGYATGAFANFMRIFLNNLKVMIFCILFAFVYGVGAIFVLTWNASVIGVAIGDFIRKELSKYASAIGFHKVSIYFQTITMGLLRYSIHGIFEVLAYFFSGLAGGIISIAVIRKDFGTKKAERIIYDTSDLLLIALILLLIAALIEVYITPIIF